ncbi:MAG: hypothetical protein AB8B55_06895 [Mariniblastus sp.]
MNFRFLIRATFASLVNIGEIRAERGGLLRLVCLEGENLGTAAPAYGRTAKPQWAVKEILKEILQFHPAGQIPVCR